MSGPEELYPPDQYGNIWMIIAVIALVLLIAAAWVFIALTRQKRSVHLSGSEDYTPPTNDMLTLLRAEYTDRLGMIEADYRAGSLTARNANLELSRVVRGFVNEYSGIEAPVLALDDLVALGVHPALVDALHRHYYPSIFRAGPPIDPIAGVEAARRVVREWY